MVYKSMLNYFQERTKYYQTRLIAKFLLLHILFFCIKSSVLRVHMRGDMNTYQFWDFKPAWKQVLFTCSFISAAFQNDPIVWWTCVGISFRVVFTWYFITRNEISFLSKWPIWNPYRFEFHFASIHVNTSKELTEHRSEIFNQNEISYRFEFISPFMWTYS